MAEQHLKSVSMLILMVPDIAQAVEFYTKLGLTQKFHLKEKWAELELGTVRIGLCPAKEVFDRRTGIVLEVADVKAFCQANKENITLVGEPVEAVHGVMGSFKDPGGNIIDIYQPTPERVKELLEKAKREEQAGKASGGCCGESEAACPCKNGGKA